MNGWMDRWVGGLVDDGWIGGWMDRWMGQWVDDTRDHSLAELTHETDHHRSRWVCFCLSKEDGHGEKGVS